MSHSGGKRGGLAVRTIRVTRHLWSQLVTLSGDSANVDEAKTAAKKIRLRYAGRCRRCGTALTAGTPALYERASKTVRCLGCSEPADSETSIVSDVTAGDPPRVAVTTPPNLLRAEAESAVTGVAGASARREFERRRRAREKRLRARHPRLGGLILSVSDQPQSTKAWALGANGEESLGRRLDALAGPSVRVLHDRRIPRMRTNIDHVVICPTGVCVIDAKQYKGRPHLRVDGGFFTERTEKLMVGSHDRSNLVDGVLKQVDLVRAALGDDAVPVRGFLCFIAADWPLFGGSFATRDVTALWPKKLAGLIAERGQLTEDSIVRIHARLANVFPTA
jgi:hypothetical protein